MANQKFTNALQRIPQACPPIWFMRQAGRYHKHYQTLRAKYSFEELCKQPLLAAEVAMGPIRDFDFDVAILFSDILFPLEAMGMGLKYDPAPNLSFHLDENNISKLRPANESIEGLKFQKHAILETRKVLANDKSLIGFVGGPWTLFTYAVEGSHKGGLEKAKKLTRLFEKFCELVIPLLIANIELQLQGGAEIVMIFDTAAGELSPAYYEEFVVPQLRKIARQYPKQVAYYAKTVQPAHLRNSLFHDPALFAGLGFDHRWDLIEALGTYETGFVQGNFDQSLLFLEPHEFKIQFHKYAKTFKDRSPDQRRGWISGLGHGVLPGTPEANVRDFVRIMREVMREETQ
jgi:uroporphyrinogen decarboxylase